MFGFLVLVFVILLATCAEITIVLLYFQLCAEDYHWWWRSFLTSGSTALYVLLYSAFYFSKLESNMYVTYVMYFGYMGIISLGLFLLMASKDPVKYKIMLSFATYVMFLAHGCTATVAVLTSDTPNYVGEGVFGVAEDGFRRLRLLDREGGREGRVRGVQRDLLRVHLLHGELGGGETEGKGRGGSDGGEGESSTQMRRRGLWHQGMVIGALCWGGSSNFAREG